MGKIIRFLLLALIIVVVLYACTLMRATPDNSATTLSGDVVPALSLAKQAVNGTTVFNSVGQVINYSYVVTNTASAALGPGWSLSSASAWYVGPGTGVKLRARSTVVHRGSLTAVVHTRIENDEKRGVLECVTSHARMGSG